MFYPLIIVLVVLNITFTVADTVLPYLPFMFAYVVSFRIFDCWIQILVRFVVMLQYKPAVSVIVTVLAILFVMLFKL